MTVGALLFFLALAVGFLVLKEFDLDQHSGPEKQLISTLESAISTTGQALVSKSDEHARTQELAKSIAAVKLAANEYLNLELAHSGLDASSFSQKQYDQITTDPDQAALLKFVELIDQTADWARGIEPNNKVITSDYEQLIKKLGSIREWVSLRSQHNHTSSGLTKHDIIAIGILVFLIVALLFESLLVIMPMIKDFTLELQNHILNEADLESKNQELSQAYLEQEHLARKVKAQSYHLEEHLKTVTDLAKQLEQSKVELHETQIVARIGGVRLDTLNNIAIMSPEAMYLLGLSKQDNVVTILDFLALFDKPSTKGILELLSDDQHKIGPFTTWLDRIIDTDRMYFKAEIKPENHIIKITLHELTQERIATQAMIKAKLLAEGAMQNKALFLSTMSHEIRTPLNTITGFVELLLQEKPRKDQLNYLDALRLSAKHLLELLNDVLDLSKIEAGKIVFKQEKILTTEFAQQLYRIYEPQAVNKGLKFSIELDESFKSAFVSDKLRLNQIITNLISNAIKFTERGFIKVRLRFEEVEQHHRLGIEVEDSGVGIPVNDLPKLFSAYHQAENTIDSPYHGTGLGLSICKQLVELQGGQVSVSSILNRGTCFSIWLPVLIDHSEDSVNWQEFNMSLGSGGLKKLSETKPSTISKLPSLAGLSVLLAEDNQTNQRLFSLFMSKWDVSCQIAANGQEVLNQLEELKSNGGTLPDVILLDLEMPVMSGFEVAKILKRHPDFQGIPVVALSGHSEVEIIDGRKDLGLSDYLVKPIDPVVLHDTLAVYLSAQKSLKQAL